MQRLRAHTVRQQALRPAPKLRQRCRRCAQACRAAPWRALQQGTTARIPQPWLWRPFFCCTRVFFCRSARSNVARRGTACTARCASGNAGGDGSGEGACRCRRTHTLYAPPASACLGASYTGASAAQRASRRHSLLFRTRCQCQRQWPGGAVAEAKVLVSACESTRSALYAPPALARAHHARDPAQPPARRCAAAQHEHTPIAVVGHALFGA
jgi:hypothetical protein